MEYDPDSMSFVNPDALSAAAVGGGGGAGRIRAESKVRLKVIGSSVQATNLCAIGSINEPFLGLLSD